MKTTKTPADVYDCCVAVQQHRARFFDSRDALCELLASSQHNYLNVAIELSSISRIVRDYFAEEEILMCLTLGDECIPEMKEHLEAHGSLIRLLESLNDLYLAAGHGHYVLVARQMYLWVRDVEAHIHEFDNYLMASIQGLNLKAA